MAIQWRKGEYFQQIVLRMIGHSHAKRKKINLDTDLNIKHKTIKLLEDNIGEDLGDFGYGEAFLDTTPKVKIMK